MNHEFARLLPDYQNRVPYVPTTATAEKLAAVFSEQRPLLSDSDATSEVLDMPTVEAETTLSLESTEPTDQA